MVKNGFAIKAKRCHLNPSLNMSQHAALILKASKVRECTNKNKTCKTLKQLSHWALVRHLLEYYIQFEVQKPKKDKEIWKGMKEKQWKD